MNRMMNGRWRTALAVTVLFALLVLSCKQLNMKSGWSHSTGKRICSPVITSISALTNKSSINVVWSTHNQCTNGTYVIERSVDNENYEIIGLKKGTALRSRSDSAAFSFTDSVPPSGTVYYRVRHFGNDNSELLSKAVSAGI